MSRGTLLFAALVIFLGVFSFFDFQRNKSKGDLSENEIKVVELSEPDISEVTVQSKTQSIVLKRESGTWKMLKPVQDETDEDAVADFINSIVNAKIQRAAEDSNGMPDWAKYDLNPGVKIDLSSEKGAKNSFTVSEKSAFDGSFYVRKGNELFIGDRSWARIAGKEANQLRSHQIWRGAGEVKRIIVSMGIGGKKQRTTLTKTGDKWSMEPAADLPLSFAKVGDWLQSVHELRAKDFVSESLRAGDAEKFYLTNPSMVTEFTVHKADKDTSMTWEFGQDNGEDVYIHTNFRPEVFKVGKHALREIRIPLIRLLDVSSAIAFPVEEARELNFTHDGKFIKFTKSEKDWSVSPAPKEGKFRSETLVDFIQKIRALDPVADEPPKDLRFIEKKDSILVRSAKKILLQMSWSQEKDALRWLKIGSYKERFKVSSERFNTLLKTDFVSKAEEPKK